MSESEDLEELKERFFIDFMDRINELSEVFIDFFGEERVDIEDSSISVIREYVLHTPLEQYISWSSIGCLSSYYNLPDASRNTIRQLWMGEKAGEELLFSNKAIATYFSPLIKEYFQRDYKCDILVHFPEVRIANENNRYVDVKDIWVKVGCSYNGTGVGSFGMARSHYPLVHLQSDYMHSHISGIPDDPDVFESPCLGSGPIKATLATLMMEFDKPIWGLFCLELDRFVRTESLRGGPYRRLEEIGAVRSDTRVVELEYSSVARRDQSRVLSKFPFIERFLKHLFESNVIKFDFSRGTYGLGMTPEDYLIAISECFIPWYNTEIENGRARMTYSELVEEGFMRTYVYKQGHLYFYGESYREPNDFTSIEGMHILTFKGRDIRLEIDRGDITQGDNKIYLLSNVFATILLHGMLCNINFKYGRDKETRAKAACFGKEARYI